MSRRPRNEQAPSVYHVTARGCAQCEIFLDDAERRLYVRLLADVAERHEWNVMAYCLMGNHVHLVIETTEPNLGKGMHALHGTYAAIFNKKHDRSGHLFGDRYWSKTIENDAQLSVVLRYVAMNPVDAGRCARPEDWPWSSHRSLAGLEPAPVWLAKNRALMTFSNGAEPPDRAYAAFVRLPRTMFHPDAPPPNPQPPSSRTVPLEGG